MPSAIMYSPPKSFSGITRPATLATRLPLSKTCLTMRHALTCENRYSIVYRSPRAFLILIASSSENLYLPFILLLNATGLIPARSATCKFVIPALAISALRFGNIFFYLLYDILFFNVPAVLKIVPSPYTLLLYFVFVKRKI